MKTIKLSKKVREKILNDNTFSLKMSMELGIQQISLFRALERNSKILFSEKAFLFFIENGFKKEELIELSETIEKALQ